MDLSIIIPVYNTEKYIERCFNSILEYSSFLKIEVIFINDGSTDSSEEILANFLSYSFVKIINQPNQGLSVARNTGIDNAKGEYIIFIDSDDWIDLAIVEKLYNITIKYGLDALSYGLEFFDEKLHKIGEKEKYPLQYNQILTGIDALCQGYQPSSACLFIYKRSFLNDNALRFVRGIAQQDVEFTIRVLLFANKIFFSDKIAYKYFRHMGSISLAISDSKLKKYLSDSIIVADLMRNNITLGMSREVIDAIEKNYNSVIWNLLWRFFTKPKEVDFEFKTNCLDILKQKELYPIRGSLKTKFQRLSCILLNFPPIVKLKLISK